VGVKKRIKVVDKFHLSQEVYQGPINIECDEHNFVDILMREFGLFITGNKVKLKVTVETL
jgi:hypothetical protein